MKAPNIKDFYCIEDYESALEDYYDYLYYKYEQYKADMYEKEQQEKQISKE